MAEEKNSIIVYADWIDKFEELSDDEAGRLIKHFFRYVNDQDPIAPDRITKLSFIDIEKSLKRDLKKWEVIKSKRSDAGKASAEARRLAKEQEQKPTKSTSVENVKYNSTNPTVSGNVSEIVNDNVNVSDIVINTKEEDFAFTEKKSELINLICDKYGYAEMRFANKQRIVSAYVSTIIKSVEDYDYFLDNINCYVLYKQLSEEKQHGFDGLYGTQTERFEDGALQKENWRQKLVNHQLYQKPKSSFEKTNDVFAKLKEIKRQQRNGNTEVQPE